MQKPVLDIVAKLRKQLFALTPIADSIEQKSSSASEKLSAWLRETELILQASGYAQCAELAGLRSKLTLAMLLTEPGINRRKKSLYAAGETVYPAQLCVNEVLKPLEAKLEEAKNILQQILDLFQPSGILNIPPGQGFSDYINGLWQYLRQHEQVRGATIKIQSLINPADIMRILAEMIEPQKTL